MNLLERIRKFLNWEASPKPDKKLLPEVYPHLKPFRLPLILTVLVILIGTLGYVIIDGFSVTDAIYQTVITFTTVGFGEIAPISEVGRIFTINLIISGFVVFSIVIGILVNELNKGVIFSVLKERHMLYKIARLKKHFVICYYNDYTIEVTKQLRKHHIPFVVIDPRDEIHKWAEESKFAYYLQAQPHAELTMLKANLSSAKGLITLSDSIADNIALIASIRLFEKEHFRKEPYNIISIAEFMSDVEKLKKLGADTVVAPTKLTAQRVSAMAIRPDMENILEEFLYQSNNPIDMHEIYISKDSWAVSKKIKELHLRRVANVSVVGITNSKDIFIEMPHDDVIVDADSKILLVGTYKGIKMAKDFLEKTIKPEELKFV